MEILMIIVGILAIIGMIAFLMHLFIKAYNKDQQEQDERILVLEKRLEEHRRINTKDFNYLDNGYLDNRNYLKELETRIQKLERKKKSDKNEL